MSRSLVKNRYQSYTVLHQISRGRNASPLAYGYVAESEISVMGRLLGDVGRFGGVVLF